MIILDYLSIHTFSLKQFDLQKEVDKQTTFVQKQEGNTGAQELLMGTPLSSVSVHTLAPQPQKAPEPFFSQ